MSFERAQFSEEKGREILYKRRRLIETFRAGLDPCRQYSHKGGDSKTIAAKTVRTLVNAFSKCLRLFLWSLQSHLPLLHLVAPLAVFKTLGHKGYLSMTFSAVLTFPYIVHIELIGSFTIFER